jgi:hypothetical protein
MMILNEELEGFRNEFVHTVSQYPKIRLQRQKNSMAPYYCRQRTPHCCSVVLCVICIHPSDITLRFQYTP